MTPEGTGAPWDEVEGRKNQKWRWSQVVAEAEAEAGGCEFKDHLDYTKKPFAVMGGSED